MYKKVIELFFILVFVLLSSNTVLAFKGPSHGPNKGNSGAKSQDIGEWRFFNDVCSLIDGSSTGDPSAFNGPRHAPGREGSPSQDIGLWSNFGNLRNDINGCAKANCVQDGVTVSHGTSRYFYIYNSHSSCNSYRQSRTCNNGVLDGNSAYQYAGCSAPVTYSNCSLNGVTVAHGSGRYFYRYSSHSSCNSYQQYRTCNNGTLSGSSLYQYTSCAPIVYNNCSLNGVTVAHGAGRYFYLYNSSNSCNSYRQYRICNNGTLTGNSAYQYASCSASITYQNCSLNGVTVAHGSGRYFYRYSSHSSCNSYRQYRTCNNGTLTGSSLYQYVSCSAPVTYRNCSLNGVTVAHGSGRYFYRYSSHSSCNSYRQYRTCNNGILSGSSLYQYASCSNVCIPNCSGKSCGNDGCGGLCGTCNSLKKPKCLSELYGICGCHYARDCSAPYNYCSWLSSDGASNEGGVCIYKYNDCWLDGTKVPHGSGHYFYQYDDNTHCLSHSQYRTCNDGKLSGSNLYKYTSCYIWDKIKRKWLDAYN